MHKPKYYLIKRLQERKDPAAFETHMRTLDLMQQNSPNFQMSLKYILDHHMFAKHCTEYLFYESY